MALFIDNLSRWVADIAGGGAGAKNRLTTMLGSVTAGTVTDSKIVVAGTSANVDTLLVTGTTASLRKVVTTGTTASNMPGAGFITIASTGVHTLGYVGIGGECTIVQTTTSTAGATVVVGPSTDILMNSTGHRKLTFDERNSSITLAGMSTVLVAVKSAFGPSGSTREPVMGSS